MAIFYKQGVDGRDLRKHMRRLLKRLVDAFGDVFVTSTGESAAGRRTDSLHYVGMAIDIRDYCIQQGCKEHVFWEGLASVCGKGFDIVPYAGFYHIEYDPK